MRRVRWLTATLLAAIGADCAAAPAFEMHDSGALLLFAGSDLWRDGTFLHGGAVWSPGGRDQPGLTFKMLLSGGTYRYHSGALGDARVTGEAVSGTFLPGWRFQANSMTFTVFGGIEVSHHHLSPDDVSNTLRGTQVGARGGFEFWCQPTPVTMIAADASATSLGPSYSGRVALGWRLVESFYVGPEVSGFVFDKSYRQWRVGAHITALQLGDLEWSAGIGWSNDSEHREGVYGKLGLLWRR
jgi:hypothetical protein